MNKTLRIKTTIVAIVALLAMLVSAVFVAMPLAGARADDFQTATLVYKQGEPTVVAGINDKANGFDPDAEFTVTIPADVTEIDIAAFTGLNNLVGVTFEQGSALKAIGDFAFAQTGITQIALPNGLEYVGAAAFAQTKLANVTIPASVTEVGQRAFGNLENKLVATVLNTSTAFGTAAFDKGSYIVADSRAAYDALAANPAFADYTAELTYPITVEYRLSGYVVATEKRLYGKPYGIELVNGVWTEINNPALGTASTAGMTWYANADGTGAALDVDGVTTLLSADDFTGDTLALYATSKGDGMVFFARNDIVYSNTSYALGTELNALLVRTIGDPIPESATVTMVGYTDPAGVAADTLPVRVGDAGHYVLNVSYSGVDYPLEIDIARREVNLGEMNVLAWRLTSVNATPTEAELLNATGITLYVYQRNDGSGAYPSRSLLSDAEKTALELSDDYAQKFVRNSVVRYRGANVTVGITGGMLETAYEIADVELPEGTTMSATDVGAYTAAATLIANPNYAFVRGVTPTDNVARGIRITVSEDGCTAYVEKDWYVVTEGNRLVDENDEDFDIADRVYGEDSVVVVPKLLHGDVESIDYGAAGDPVSLTLMYGNMIVGEETFTRGDWYKYINESMPAGDYQLRVRAQEVVAVEYDADDENHENPNYISHGGFDDIISFTVVKRDINTLMTDRIDRAIKGKTFTYEFDGSSHLYDADAAETIADALAEYTATFKRNGVWASSVYDDMFGEFEISFNLARLLSDVYYSANSLPAKTSDPDRYTVYYKISAPNYFDSIDNEDTVRTECMFDVVNVMAIDQPVLLDRAYTGNTVVADIVDTAIYTVTKNSGGINVGEYEVELTLVNPEFYMWKGQSVDEERSATETITFSILPANNRWAVEPGVTFWVEGSYDAEANAVYGAASFGNMVVEISDMDGNVVYSTVSGVNKLAKLGAGTYRLSATVEATDNYDALSYAIFISVFKRQLLPWWGILLVVIGALLLAALIILILWKKGVFQLLTDKIVLSIRTKATIDATIAAVRAGKVAAAAKASVAEAEARDKAQERAAARKAAQEAERAKSTEKKAAELEAKAQSEVERADKIKAKAEEMQARAAAMKLTAEEEAAAKPKASKKKAPKNADGADKTDADSKPTEE